MLIDIKNTLNASFKEMSIIFNTTPAVIRKNLNIVDLPKHLSIQHTYVEDILSKFALKLASRGRYELYGIQRLRPKILNKQFMRSLAARETDLLTELLTNKTYFNKFYESVVRQRPFTYVKTVELDGKQYEQKRKIGKLVKQIEEIQGWLAFTDYQMSQILNLTKYMYETYYTPASAHQPQHIPAPLKRKVGVLGYAVALFKIESPKLVTPIHRDYYNKIGYRLYEWLKKPNLTRRSIHTYLHHCEYKDPKNADLIKAPYVTASSPDLELGHGSDGIVAPIQQPRQLKTAA